MLHNLLYVFLLYFLQWFIKGVWEWLLLLNKINDKEKYPRSNVAYERFAGRELKNRWLFKQAGSIIDLAAFLLALIRDMILVKGRYVAQTSVCHSTMPERVQLLWCRPRQRSNFNQIQFREHRRSKCGGLTLYCVYVGKVDQTQIELFNIVPVHTILNTNHSSKWFHSERSRYRNYCLPPHFDYNQIAHFSSRNLRRFDVIAMQKKLQNVPPG